MPSHNTWNIVTIFLQWLSGKLSCIIVIINLTGYLELFLNNLIFDDRGAEMIYSPKQKGKVLLNRPQRVYSWKKIPHWQNKTNEKDYFLSTLHFKKNIADSPVTLQTHSSICPLWECVKVCMPLETSQDLTPKTPSKQNCVWTD